MRRTIGSLALILGVVIVGFTAAQQLTGNQVDCLGEGYLSDIRILEELPSAADKEAAARDAVRSNAVTPGAEIQQIKFGVIASDSLGMQKGIPAFIAVVPRSEDQGYVSVPIGHAPVRADAPCEVVVVSADGEYLFSHLVHSRPDAQE